MISWLQVSVKYKLCSYGHPVYVHCIQSINIEMICIFFPTWYCRMAHDIQWQSLLCRESFWSADDRYLQYLTTKWAPANPTIAYVSVFYNKFRYKYHTILTYEINSIKYSPLNNNKIKPSMAQRIRNTRVYILYCIILLLSSMSGISIDVFSKYFMHSIQSVIYY